MRQMVEVLYSYLGQPELEECASVEAALEFIKRGEDNGNMSSLGVLVDGEPLIWDGYVSQDAPTHDQASRMVASYAEARRRDEVLRTGRAGEA